jgi:serpin B
VARSTASPSLQTAEAEQAFALNLLDRLSGVATSNLVVSPSSLASALAMIEQGARGSTAAQIATVLGNAGASPGQIGVQWGALARVLTAAGSRPGAILDEGDAIWIQRGLSVEPDFLTGLAQTFGTGAWQADFAGNPTGAANLINSWVTTMTHGEISNLVTPEQVADAPLVLTDAIYFDAAWINPFDPRRTSKRSFTTASGTELRVSTMNADDLDTPSYIGNGVEAVQLPYNRARFAALVVMPTAESLPSYLHDLNGVGLNALVDDLDDKTPVDLAIPKFSLSSSFENLETVLQAMGMSSAFTPQANFSGITASQAFYVAHVIQQANISVTEQGTKAAAATAIIPGAGAALAPPDVHTITINHPFLFLVRDTVTGAIVFEAEVANPASAS